MAKHTMSDLYQMQGMSLKDKIKMTKRRIQEWVEEWGLDGVYVAFSGGKDSTVLLTIAREMYPGIKAMFVNTGLEYPEIVRYVKTWDNVDILKPKMTFKQVIFKYGYPFIGKEVSERIYYAQRWLTSYCEQTNLDRPTDRPTRYGLLNLCGVRAERFQKTKEIIPEDLLYEFAKSGEKGTYKIREMCGITNRENGEASMYNYSKWMFAVNAPFKISNKCCDVMKKSPAHKYSKETGRKSITAMMASESRLRAQQWLRNGCNGFKLAIPVSNPMAFWTEQDVLQYIWENKVKICSVYGEVVIDYAGAGEIENQLSFRDLGGEWELFDTERPLLKTTGCKRTGCMFCGFGCHNDKPGEGRFERMKVTHPKQYNYIMKPVENGGLGYKEIIDWLNEHGNLNIMY